MFKIVREGREVLDFLFAIANEVECVGEANYAESVWMKVRGERGRSALYIGCVYMPTDCSGIATIDDSYNLLKEDVLTFKQKGKGLLMLE